MSRIVHGIERFFKDFTERTQVEQWRAIRRLIYLAAVIAFFAAVWEWIING